MKKLLTLLFILMTVTVRAEVIYSFDAVNSPVGSSKLETKGATLAVASGTKDFSSANQNTIKYSKDTQYKVTLPNTARVTKIVLTAMATKTRSSLTSRNLPARNMARTTTSSRAARITQAQKQTS